MVIFIYEIPNVMRPDEYPKTLGEIEVGRKLKQHKIWMPRDAGGVVG